MNINATLIFASGKRLAITLKNIDAPPEAIDVPEVVADGIGQRVLYRTAFSRDARVAVYEEARSE